MILDCLFSIEEKSMKQEPSDKSLSFRSDNRKSKIKNVKLAGIVALGFAFAMCGAVARAQQPTKIPRIGYLSLAAKTSPRDEAFVNQLRDLGWIDGQNIAIEYRWAANKTENLAKRADELVALKVDLIAASATPAVQAAKNATKTIPIVMVLSADAVESGFVASRPSRVETLRGTPIFSPSLRASG